MPNFPYFVFLNVKLMILDKPQIPINIPFCGSKYDQKKSFDIPISYKTDTTWYT